jgi:hypothetical protein
MPIETIKDSMDAAEALKAWFHSQDMAASEAVMTCETFIGLMIVQNGTDAADIQAKYNFVLDHIRFIVATFRPQDEPN